MKRKQFNMKIDFLRESNCMVKIGDLVVRTSPSALENAARDGESPVKRLVAKDQLFFYPRVV